MPAAGFEHTISAGELPQTYALVRAATGTGNIELYINIYYLSVNDSLTQRDILRSFPIVLAERPYIEDHT